MDYAELLRRAIARLEREPSLVHGDEFRWTLIEWLAWSAEAFESGDHTRRALKDHEAAPGIKLARLLTKGRNHGEVIPRDE